MKKAIGFPWPNPDSVYATAGPEYEMAITMEGHTFNVKPIDDCGINTGRRRYEVRCITCGIIVHPGTTGPSCLISHHLDERESPSPPPLQQLSPTEAPKKTTWSIGDASDTYNPLIEQRADGTVVVHLASIKKVFGVDEVVLSNKEPK